MAIRYRMPLFAQTISVGSGRLDAAPDGWFYPRSPEEAAALVAAGCVVDDTSSGATPRPITTETPGYQALVSAGGNLVSAYRFWGLRSQVAATSTLVSSRAVKAVCDAPFNQVRVTLMHYGASTPTIKVAVAATETCATDTSNNIGRSIVGGVAQNAIDSTTDSFGWRTGTFSGAASVSFAGSGTISATDSAAEILTSDWISLQSVPRADGGVGHPLLVSVFAANAATQALSWINATGGAAMRTPTAANRGRVLQFSRNTSDTVANPSAGTWAVVEDSIPIMIEVRYRVKAATVAAIGDSLFQNEGLVADKITSWLYRACADVSTQDYPVVPCNIAGSSMGSAAYWREAKRVMDLSPPTVAIYSAWTPNDPPYSSDALTRHKIQNMEGRVSEFLAYCKTKRIQPILDTGVPYLAGLSASADALRKSYVQNIKGIAASVGAGLIDSDAFFSDSGSPANIKAPYNFGDNIHFNEAGVEAKAVQLVVPALRLALGL